MSIGPHIDHDLIKTLGAKSYAGAARILAVERGVRCGQIFIMQPQAAKWVEMDDGDVRACAKNGFHLYAHANYMSHMCNGAMTGIIHMQIKRSGDLDLHGLIIHLENASVEENVRAAVGLCAYRLQAGGARLIFEVNALTKNPPFDTGAKLKAFVNGVAAHGYGPDAFGVCVDTAHLWSCGQDIRTSEAVKAWLDEFDGARWMALFHLNDNESQIGGRDLHATIGLGAIWPIVERGTTQRSMEYATIRRYPTVPRDKEPGFIEVLRYAKEHRIDVILERAGEKTGLVLIELSKLKAINDMLR
jgi:endonuclease IV